MSTKSKALKRALKSTTEHQADLYTSAMALVGIMRTHAVGGKKLSRAVTAIAVTASSISVAKNVWTFIQNYRESDAFFVKIREDDRLFQVAEAWLMEIMPEEDKISLYTKTSINTETSNSGEYFDHPSDTGSSKKVTVSTTFDGSVVQEVTLGKHKIRLEASIPDGDRTRSKKEATSVREFKFTCSSLESREAVLEELRKRSNILSKAGNQLFVSRSWGNFARRTAPERAIDSVILKKNQMERICDHIDTFFKSEMDYINTGIPYHTGILLYGLPGTGKSSTATAIGSKFGLDVYYISLATLDGDEALQDAFSNIPPKTMIVLEDVDIAEASHERDPDNEARSGVTMQGLLNVLDGQLSPHGTVAILTTNHLEELDEAIIRPGRVDLIEEISALDFEQLSRLCEYFMGSVPRGLPKISVSDNVTSADVLGILRKHIPNFSNASSELIKYLKSVKKKELVVA